MAALAPLITLVAAIRLVVYGADYLAPDHVGQWRVSVPVGGVAREDKNLLRRFSSTF
jgi:hypothetical protein